jgi:lipopolysaccharide transport system ATP-binding protein
LSDPSISVQHVSKSYRRAERVELLSERLRHALRIGKDERPERGPELFHALTDVSFDVEEGDVLGLIGLNGAGKSTLLKIISQITRPTSGRVVIRGTLGSLLEVGTGFHAELTGRENVYLNGAIIGMPKQEIRRLFDEIVDFAETGDFIDTPLKHYSSGMQTRLAFSIAAHVDARTLILDEVLSVGDYRFQSKCIEKIRELSRGDRTVLLVSHNLSTVLDICNKCALLENGRLVDFDDARSVVARYQGQVTTEVGEWAGPEGSLRLYDIGFIGDDGSSVQFAENGGRARFGMKLDVARPFRQVGVVVAIEDGNLHRITALDSRLTGDFFELDAGSHQFEVDLDDLPLARGDYGTKLEIYDASGRVLSVLSGPVLRVENGAEYGRRTFHVVEWHGSVHVRQRWAVSRTDTGVE